MQKLILTEEMEEGMVLAQPLKNKFGQVLLGAEVRLENKHKYLFKTWGVESIFIKLGDGDEGISTIDDNVKNEAMRILRKRVLWQPKNANEEDIIEIGLEKIVEKLIG